MKLYSATLSLFSRKVEIALLEKGLAYERVFVPFTQLQGYNPKDPAVVATNPKYEVPVLIDGETTLYDSTIIIEYLEDAYPLPRLYPAEPRTRAECRLLDVFADEVMLIPLRAFMHRTEPRSHTDDSWRAAEAKAAEAAPVLAGYLRLLDGKLGSRRYALGEFSAADISVFMPVFWGWRLAAYSLQDYPDMSQWYARLAARPAFARIVDELKAADLELSAPVPGAYR